jgi:serine/threonine protein kinase
MHTAANYTVKGKDIAVGGEARISVLKDETSGKLVAYKQFLQPNNPLFATPADKAHCATKLTELYDKLRNFPKDLPKQVIRPLKIQVAEVNGQRHFIGYTMPYIENSYQLLELMSNDGRRNHNLSMMDITKLFLKLHDLIAELHQKNVVIGDVRPQNILIKDETPYLIDTDSMQFGTFKCKVFDPVWVDPRLCAKHGGNLTRVSSPDKGSDWFTFASMLYNALTGIAPYAGVLRTQAGLVSEATRKLKGLPISHQGVIIPKFALKPEYLNAELADYFKKIFTDSSFREPPPRALLDSLSWKRCSSTQHEYSSKTCPCGNCGGAGALLGLRNIFDSLTKPARLGIAGASLAGALVGYKLYTEREQLPKAYKAMTDWLFSVSTPTSNVSTVITDPKLGSLPITLKTDTSAQLNAAHAKSSDAASGRLLPPLSLLPSTTSSTNATHKFVEPLWRRFTAKAAAQTTQTPDNGAATKSTTTPRPAPDFLNVDLGPEPSARADTSSAAPSASASNILPGISTIQTLTDTRWNQRSPATPRTARPTVDGVTSVKYTAQNSVDISKIYLTEGQQSFHQGNIPYRLIGKYTDHAKLTEGRPYMRISEGVIMQAVAIGLDAIRAANQGTFPPGSKFRLVVTHKGPSGRRLEKQFLLPERLIPTERELSYTTVMDAADGMRDIYQYFQEALVVHVAAHGQRHLSSAFCVNSPSLLGQSAVEPVRVTILRDTETQPVAKFEGPLLRAATSSFSPPINFTALQCMPQNSADISKIYEPAGQSVSLKTVTKSLVCHAVAEWFDANHIANPNPSPAPFDLLFSPVGSELRGYFYTPPAFASAFANHSYEKAMAVIDSMHDLSQYMQTNIGFRLSPHGATHSQVNFVLAGKVQTPVNLYVLGNEPQYYRQQRSSDISTIYVAGEEPLNHDLLRKKLIVRAVARGLDAMRRANHGSFPAGSKFRLVILHDDGSGRQEQRQFLIPAKRIPTEQELSNETAIKAALSMLDVCQYFQDNLIVQVLPYGANHVESAFLSPKSPDKPVRIYLLRDPL